MGAVGLRIGRSTNHVLLGSWVSTGGGGIAKGDGELGFGGGLIARVRRRSLCFL